MPNLETELSCLKEAQFFANFDMSLSCLQLLFVRPLEGRQSSITPEVIFTPTRVLHATNNVFTHLQSSLTGITPARLRARPLVWLNYILLHAPTIGQLLYSILSFFAACSEFNTKLHPAKCIFLTKEVRWCGHLISVTGICYIPLGLDGPLSMKSPTNGSHL